MRSTSVVALVLMVLAFVAGNLVVTAGRSLVSVALSTRLLSKERKAEKHEGVDDVILWHLEDGRTLQVDPAVDELAGTGSRIEKSLGTRTLAVDGRSVEIPRSDDFEGMKRVALPVAFAAAMLALAACRRRRDD